jgi:hypothetical protein
MVEWLRRLRVLRGITQGFVECDILDMFGYAPRRGMGTWILRITRIKTDLDCDLDCDFEMIYMMAMIF